MFDANMRHLRKGKTFFCKVHYIESGVLYDAGVRNNDIILCEMLDNCHNNPRVKFTINDVDIICNAEDDWEDKWIVYEGNTDGSGFLPKCDSKERALDIIKNWRLK